MVEMGNHPFWCCRIRYLQCEIRNREYR